MIAMKQELRPFTVPNFVLPVRSPGKRQDGPKFDEGIPLHALDDETIRQLLDQFRIDLWLKVNERRASEPQSEGEQ